MSLRAEFDSVENEGSFVRRWVTAITASVALVALTTAVLWLADLPLKQNHLIFIYFVPTAFIAVRYGSISAIGVTVASVLIAAYLLYSPRFSFAVASPLDILEIALFSLLTLLASRVVSGFANDRVVARRRLRSRAAPNRERRLSARALWASIRFRRL